MIHWILVVLEFVVLVAVLAVVWSFIGTLVAAAVFRVTGYHADWRKDSDSRWPIALMILGWPLVITIGLAGYLFFIATRTFYRWCVAFIATTTATPQPDYGE